MTNHYEDYEEQPVDLKEQEENIKKQLKKELGELNDWNEIMTISTNSISTGSFLYQNKKTKDIKVVVVRYLR